MIREALAGKRIAVTGATGFLGTALVERLLRSVPDCRLVLVVRAGRRGAADRVRREIFRNDCFDRLRREWGAGFDDNVAARVTAVAGDVAVDGLGLDDAGRAALAQCSVAIHSAASVSFDSPLDAAVEVNLLGAARVAQVLAGTGAHLIAVSTAYVAGRHRGGHEEGPEGVAGPCRQQQPCAQDEQRSEPVRSRGRRRRGRCGRGRWRGAAGDPRSGEQAETAGDEEDGAPAERQRQQGHRQAAEQGADRDGRLLGAVRQALVPGR
ncbi:MAG: SDR family oxidoreductase, partial [Actinobacteria bacterium]|nr:SDR family oxidoreductase [Actinomycetota bacterium]